MSSTLQAIVSMKECGNHKWREIGSHVGVTKDQARTKYINWQRYGTDGVGPGECPLCAGRPTVEGITSDLPHKSVSSVWDRAFHLQDEKSQYESNRDGQKIVIPGNSAFGIAYLSDLHFGDGADYRQMKRDAELIRETPRMYAAFNGDGSNNWIVQKLQRLQLGQRLSHDDEWILFNDFLCILGDDLLVVALGNHDLWTLVLAGVDRIRDSLVARNTRVLYDDYEVVYDLALGESSWRVKQRHIWKGSSVFNPTHGIEVAWQRGGDEFDIGIGGHDHYGTICRPFFRHGKKRFAVKIGTYSLWNKLGRKMGAHPSMNRGCGALIFQEGKEPEFFNDLETAARFLEFLNGN